MIKLKEFIHFRRCVVIFCVFLCINVFIYVYCKLLHYKKERETFLREDDDDDYPVNPYIDGWGQERLFEVETIVNIKSKIKLINKVQTVQNQDLYGAVRPTNTIIVIQVHNSLSHLQELVESLKTAAGISRTLLIFSHDRYDHNINECITQITFARVMQIFYPYSVQLHPIVFPGYDSKFCPNYLHCIQSDRRNITLIQNKHHWWWQLNYVFDNLTVTQNHNRAIIFLEDDQYVTEDFIYMLNLLERKMPVLCPQCQIIGLGVHHPFVSQYHVREGGAVIGTLGSTEYSMGLAFNRTVWNTIKKLSHNFCYFNDYNWDYSLRYLATKTPSGQINMFSTEGPRVFRIGKCKGDEWSQSCNLQVKIDAIYSFLSIIRRGLYSRHLLVKSYEGVSRTVTMEHGGWDDVRDRELCKYMSSK